MFSIPKPLLLIAAVFLALALSACDGVPGDLPFPIPTVIGDVDLDIDLNIDDGEVSLDDLELKGTVDEVGDGFVVVEGITLTVGPDTEIEGILEAGAFVEVHFVVQEDGSFLATKIEVKDAEDDDDVLEFVGTVEAVENGSVVVSGIDFLIDSVTVIEGTLAVGALVEVHFVVQEDGSFLALEIKVEDAEEVDEEDEGICEFVGEIESFGAESWVVGGFTFLIGPETEIQGTPEVGLMAKVEFVMEDGSFTALEIKVEDTEDEEEEDEGACEFVGEIESFGATSWVVGGFTFLIGPETEIQGTPEEGLMVKVEFVMEDGNLLATGIEVKDAEDEVCIQDDDDEDDDEDEDDEDEDEDDDEDEDGEDEDDDEEEGC